MSEEEHVVNGVGFDGCKLSRGRDFVGLGVVSWRFRGSLKMIDLLGIVLKDEHRVHRLCPMGHLDVLLCLRLCLRDHLLVHRAT